MISKIGYDLIWYGKKDSIIKDWIRYDMKR